MASVRTLSLHAVIINVSIESRGWNFGKISSPPFVRVFCLVGRGTLSVPFPFQSFPFRSSMSIVAKNLLKGVKKQHPRLYNLRLGISPWRHHKKLISEQNFGVGLKRGTCPRSPFRSASVSYCFSVIYIARNRLHQSVAMLSLCACIACIVTLYSYISALRSCLSASIALSPKQRTGNTNDFLKSLEQLKTVSTVTHSMQSIQSIQSKRPMSYATW